MMVACPACGHTEEQTVAQSIHGPRLPAAVDDILSGRFQRVECTACGARFEMDAPLVFLDFESFDGVSVSNVVEAFHEAVAEALNVCDTYEIGMMMNATSAVSTARLASWRC